jgi:hypothetical protein
VTIAIHVDQTRDESMLGASEAAGVLGLDKYKPPIAVWRRHRGLSVPDDAAQREPAYWGTVLEPVVRGHYAVKSERVVVVPTGSIVREGWLRCTPDGISIPVPRGQDPHCDVMATDYNPDHLIRSHAVLRSAGCLQVKTCSAWLIDDWRDGPPPNYEVQCRVELAVTGLPWADLVCLCGGQRYLGPFRIDRDMEIEERILGSLREFWDMVKSGVEPTVDHTEAWRLHVSEKLERSLPRMVKADGVMLDAISSWRDRRRVTTLAEQSEGEAINQVLLSLSASGSTKADAGDLGRVTAYKTVKGKWALRAPTIWKDDIK